MRQFNDRALGRNVSHAGDSGFDPEARKLGVLWGKGIRGVEFSIATHYWLIQTLTERLHVSKRTSGLCSCELGAYHCSHSNQLMYDLTQRQGAVDRGEVLARWC